MDATQLDDVEALDARDAEEVAGGTEIGRMIGYGVGYLFGLIAHADPFDGNYYGVGA